MPLTDPPVFAYSLGPLPPSAIGRRWGWQLWSGERLLAGGWRFGERSALSALRTAASRSTHELAGVRALRPDRTDLDGTFLPGTTVRVLCGAFECVLAPRREPLRTAA